MLAFPPEILSFGFVIAFSASNLRFVMCPVDRDAVHGPRPRMSSLGHASDQEKNEETKVTKKNNLQNDSKWLVPCECIWQKAAAYSGFSSPGGGCSAKRHHRLLSFLGFSLLCIIFFFALILWLVGISALTKTHRDCIQTMQARVSQKEQEVLLVVGSNAWRFPGKIHQEVFW